MLREDVIKEIEEKKIMVVVRNIYDDELIRLADALAKGGVKCFEITYDQTDPDTLTKIERNIKKLDALFGDKLLLGVGTVLTPEQVVNAKKAGAKFIVSPNFNEEVVKKTIEEGLVSIPGCMTPTEICSADEAGADFIKLVPAGTLGLKYCKDIYAPLHHVRYLATVGVSEETFEEYLKIGFAGAGISSMLIDKKCRDEGNYAELTRRAQRFAEIASRY